MTSRQTFPDQLRGIALLGIVLVNAPYFALDPEHRNTGDTLAVMFDRGADFLVKMLAEGKFYLLFSFLFGYSANFIVKAGAPEELRAFGRRLLALGVLGLLHAVFFFIGDILLSYAILGLLLLALIRRPDRSVLLASLIAFVVTAAWLLLLARLSMFLIGDGDPDPQGAALARALAGGTFLEAAEARLTYLPVVVLVLAFLQWGLAFSAFCLGLVAGRRRWLADIAANLPSFRKAAIFGLSIGLPIQAATAAYAVFGPGAASGAEGTAHRMASTVIGVVFAPILSAGYVGLLACLSAQSVRWLAFVEPSGRASLTMYLGESLVLATVFCGWGFGLFGSLGPAALTLIAFGVWLGLQFAIRVWFLRFRQGPVESLLSRFTHAGG